MREIAAICALSFCLAAGNPSALANLVSDPTFTSFTTYGTTNTTPPFTGTIYGQIGTVSGSTYLTSSSWSSVGYNFVFSAATVDVGTQGSGANTGQPYEEPGQATVTENGNTVGNTYMWGKNNGGVSTITAPPNGGDFIAADGAYEQGAISQTVNGLTVGHLYSLTFYWAAAQQQAYTGATTENWSVTLGTQTQTTASYNLASMAFSGWMQQTFTFTATSNSEVLSFLASGTPNGEPPFSLLSGVDLESVPEISNAAIFGAFGVGCVGFQIFRRRRLEVYRTLADWKRRVLR